MADPACNECITGTIHAGLPVGTEQQVHGLNTYVTGNTVNPKAIVVMYSDIFGLLLPNNKLIADALAKNKDYLVYLPDFFLGDAVPLKIADLLIPVNEAKQSTFFKYTGLLASAPTFIMWMTRHKQGPTEKICNDFLAKLRNATINEGKKIGIVGFCWGGRYAIRAGLESNKIEISGKKVPLVDAVVALHPSNLVLPADVQGIAVPASFGWGKEDPQVKIETMGTVQKAHEDEKSEVEQHHQVYTPGRHGFAVRGNPDDPAEKKCLEDSITQILSWFEKWL